MLWMGIAGMAMMFAGLTSGYVVSRSSLVQDEKWLTFALPSAFIISTVMAVLASVLNQMAVSAFRKEQASGKMMLAAAWIFGLLFCVFQVSGWIELYDQGIFFTGPGSNTAGSWVYAITFMHLLHVSAGLVSGAITTIKGFLGRYDGSNMLGVELNAIYWHFVDALWIYLFIFLSLIR